MRGIMKPCDDRLVSETEVFIVGWHEKRKKKKKSRGEKKKAVHLRWWESGARRETSSAIPATRARHKLYLRGKLPRPAPRRRLKLSGASSIYFATPFSQSTVNGKFLLIHHTIFHIIHNPSCRIENSAVSLHLFDPVA